VEARGRHRPKHSISPPINLIIPEYKKVMCGPDAGLLIKMR